MMEYSNYSLMHIAVGPDLNEWVLFIKKKMAAIFSALPEDWWNLYSEFGVNMYLHECLHMCVQEFVWVYVYMCIHKYIFIYLKRQQAWKIQNSMKRLPASPGIKTQAPALYAAWTDTSIRELLFEQTPRRGDKFFKWGTSSCPPIACIFVCMYVC